jgi:membrane fusion protein, copper/silver efflux system
MNRRHPSLIALSLLAAGIALPGLAALPTVRVLSPADHVHAETLYQCPMHPWIKSDKPGQRCTLCGMDLVAVTGASGPPDPDLVTLTPAQTAVTGVATSEVVQGRLTRTLRVSGVIEDDDTRHRILAARVPGRIERLQVNSIGAEVEAGAPLATVFSPEMLTAQRQYVERIRAGAVATPPSERAAARERLLELGLTEEEIRILEGTLKPTAMVNIRAPMSGTVVSRAVYEGQYVRTNDPLFEIGDFSRMWFVFDAYEPDLAWLNVGQTVGVRVASLSGQVLEAPITFIEPSLDARTRTARVRVVLDNLQGRLRHRETALAEVALTGPETLLVPRAAVLQHGGRPVVYVAVDGDRNGQGYRAREVRLGRSGDTQAEVLAGLEAGERVVTEGGLILDAQAQLAHAAVQVAASGPVPVLPAKTPAGAAPMSEDAYGLLRTLVFAMADAAAALASDDLDAYRRGLPVRRAALAAFVKGDPAAARGDLSALNGKLGDPVDLDAARRQFEPLSTAVADLARAEQMTQREQIWVYQCPMTPVLGTGRWISRRHELRNPFFAGKMIGCGDEVK